MTDTARDRIQIMTSIMKSNLLRLVVGVLLFSATWQTLAADPPAPERNVQERLEDLEAYVNNGARNASTNAPSKIAGPGPGHNGDAACAQR